MVAIQAKWKQACTFGVKNPKIWQNGLGQSTWVKGGTSKMRGTKNPSAASPSKEFYRSCGAHVESLESYNASINLGGHTKI